MEKEARIFIRIQKQKKEHWKKLCSKRQISLSSLIIDSVEKRIFDDERRKVLMFLEKQDNIFVKIENNINQVAKIVNAQKFMRSQDLMNFREQLNRVIELKEQQNEIFMKIYSLIVSNY